MYSDNKIAITIDGIEVEGLVTYRSKYEFSVTITKPFKGLTGGSHIPCFIRRYDFDGKYGNRRIMETLGDLFEQGNEAIGERKN